METEYNAAGQLTDYTYPDGTPVTRGYSPRGELTTIGYEGTTVDTRTYDDGGRMLTSSYNNGVSETRAYNNDNTLASISFSGAPIGDLSYTWDANKNKTSESITGVMSGMGFSIPTNGYDAEDRLVGYQRTDNNLNQSWNLSLVGDWNSVTTNAATQSRTHGPTHEILTAGSDSITHDPKGNITYIPSSLRLTASRLTWDFDNRLMSMDVNEDSTADATFKYDALGRRVQKNSTVYALTGQQVIAEYSAGTATSSPTEQYVFASYIDEPVLKDGTGGLVYYHRNQQYSILALTSSSGVVERYSYDAYGKLAIKDGSGAAIASSSTGNTIAYTGRNFDSETRDYYYRARYYDLGLGRFCGRDPIGFTAGDASIYRYVVNNPFYWVDPSGLEIDIDLLAPEDACSGPLNDLPEKPGVITVAAHGNSQFIVDSRKHPKNKVPHLNPCDLAKLIKSHPKYRPGIRIELYSCNTGNTSRAPEPFADLLVKDLDAGCTVCAPDGYLHPGYYYKTRLQVIRREPDKDPENGGFKTFPRKNVKSPPVYIPLR